ncbi:hypothetical protein F5Y18DRAFT_423309 [Xylariaceae sp. FL1019]|nr:hypothetical protein F5Y18DRAFT_423309 [Xylariaceae sp. FL1019]
MPLPPRLSVAHGAFVTTRQARRANRDSATAEHDFLAAGAALRTAWAEHRGIQPPTGLQAIGSRMSTITPKDQGPN